MGNFLDLAQLEPGVQIQDGGNFGKDGFSSISVGGRGGRAARAPTAAHGLGWLVSYYEVQLRMALPLILPRV